MSIWTDLLLLAGHAATPSAAAAIAPALFPAQAADAPREPPAKPARPAKPAKPAPDDRAAARRADDCAREDLQPRLVPRPEPAPELARAVARPGRVSPNDLFW